MKDWKGNDIKPGDTVVIVETIQKLTYSKFDALILAACSFFVEPAPRIKHGWWPVTEVKIIPCIFSGFDSPPVLVEFEDKTIAWLTNESLKENLVVCIKGVSDNETEYYLNYFK